MNTYSMSKDITVDITGYTQEEFEKDKDIQLGIIEVSEIVKPRGMANDTYVYNYRTKRFFCAHDTDIDKVLFAIK